MAAAARTESVERRIQTPDLIAELQNREHEAHVEDVFTEPLHTLALYRARHAEPTVARFRCKNAAGGFGRIGRVIAMPAGVPMEVRGLGGPIRAIRCRFTPELLQRVSGNPHFEHRDELDACINVRETMVRALLERLARELEKPGFAADAYVEAIGTGLVVTLARYLWDSADTARPSGALSAPQIKLVTDYIDGNERAPTLSDVARLIGFSPRHLSRTFRRQTGQTLQDFIEQVRFERACTLLTEGNLLVKEVAFRLGFSCSSNFAAAFRKRAAMSPQDYARIKRPQPRH